MALIACPVSLGDLDIGVLAANTGAGMSTIALNATNTKQAMTFLADGATADVAEFEVVAVTSAQDMKVGLYSLDAVTGDPTTLVGTEVTLAAASVTAGWKTVSGLGAALTRGLPYALVFSWAGTAGALTLRTLIGQYATRCFVDLHYVQAYTTAWQGKSLDVQPVLYLETSGGAALVLPGARPVRNVRTIAMVSGNRLCLRYKAPIRGEVIGCRVVYNTAADHQIKAILYADDGTTLLSDGPTIDEDYTAENGNSARMLLLSTPTITEIGTWYRLGIELASSISVTVFDVAAAKHLDMMDGGGQNFHSIDYTSGAWNAAVTTRRPLIVPIYRTIDDAPGGGATARQAPQWNWRQYA